MTTSSIADTTDRERADLARTADTTTQEPTQKTPKPTITEAKAEQETQHQKDTDNTDTIEHRKEHTDQTTTIKKETDPGADHPYENTTDTNNTKMTTETKQDQSGDRKHGTTLLSHPPPKNPTK